VIHSTEPFLFKDVYTQRRETTQSSTQNDETVGETGGGGPSCLHHGTESFIKCKRITRGLLHCVVRPFKDSRGKIETILPVPNAEKPVSGQADSATGFRATQSLLVSFKTHRGNV